MNAEGGGIKTKISSDNNIMQGTNFFINKIKIIFVYIGKIHGPNVNGNLKLECIFIFKLILMSYNNL